MKVLILGGAGQVGVAVARAAPAHHEVVVMTRASLDIGDARSVAEAVADVDPEWVINAAAYTAVDLAEDQPALATAVNDTAVGVLAAAAARTGARMLHLSTDFVFDGASSRAYLPSDLPAPLNVYGRSKLRGEQHVLDGGCEGVVLRTSWVYAAAGKNFPLTMLRLMREREQVRVVADQIGSPTWAGGLAPAIWDIVALGVPPGIYHWSDLGVASWYDFAVAIQEEALSRGLLSRAISVVPIATAEYPTRARRPAFSLLDTAATRALLTTPAVHWRHNLRTMLDELRAA